MNIINAPYRYQPRLVPSMVAVLAAFFATSSAHAAPKVVADFNSATDVPVTASGYSATGKSLDLDLHCVPPVGAALTVINNTSLDFIQGTFKNLAQGKKVSLDYGGVTYRFVADYYGGTGNDLVLHWADTTAVGWGWDGAGALGDNRVNPRQVLTPVNTTGVLSGKTVIAVDAGREFSLALCSDGTLASWGLNNYGNLGNNDTADSHTPVAVDATGVLAGKTVIAISTGSSHSLVLCSDGTMAAWGNNSDGELGDGTADNSSVPVAVTTSGVLNGKTVVAISAGTNHSLALCSDGTVAAWGYGYYGSLGNNDEASSSVPVLVDTSGALAGKTVTSISAGGFHDLALCSDGTVVAWGSGGNGELGNGSTSLSFVPVVVDATGVLAGKTVVQVFASSASSKALCSDGTIVAWGWNGGGQFGNASIDDSAVPVLTDLSGVLAGKTVAKLSGGELHTLALCSDGTASSWGNNLYDQLGDNTTAESLLPATVDMNWLPAGSRFVAITGGETAIHSLGLIATPSRDRNPAPGSYAGLVEPQSGTARGAGSQGYLNLTLTASRTFTGTLALNGVRHAITGKFNQKGVAHWGTDKSLTIHRTGLPDLVIALQFDLLNALTGSVTQQTGSVISGVSIVQAEHVVPIGSAPVSGSFNVILPYLPAGDSLSSFQLPGVTPADYPQGHGLGKITVASAGTAVFSGTLADGTAVSISAPLTGNVAASTLTIPMFAQLYASGKGLISASLIPDASNSDSDLSTGIDYLHWFRPANALSSYYPNGWPQGVVTLMLGAHYTVTPGQSVLPGLAAPSSSGNAVIQADNEPGVDISYYPVNLSSTDVVSFPPPVTPGLTLALARATGQFTGSLPNVVSGTPPVVFHPTYKGIVYQKGNYTGGWGFYLTAPTIGQSRAVLLLPHN